MTYFNDSGYNSIMYAEGNSRGVITMHRIESKFDNDHNHVLHDIPKQYIYG